MTTRIAVIGGGCAGLSAAAILASKGLSVTLFESSPTLGGRTRSLAWKGQRLDNGQHILLGAYRDTLRLLKLAGMEESSAFLRLPLQLEVGQFSLRTMGWLPAPLHLLYGLLSCRGLSLSDRLKALRFMAWLQLVGFRLKQDEPLAGLLIRKRQSAPLIQLLWEPLCLAAMNTPLASVSAQTFLNVLRDSFAQQRHDSDLMLPKLDLLQLLVEPLAQYIRSQRGTIKTRTGVAQISQGQDGFTVSMEDGSTEHFTHIVVAVQPFRVLPLLEALPDKEMLTSVLSTFAYQPIYTVYLQYEDHVSLGIPMKGLAGGYGQWVFDRGLLDNQPGLMAVVISAEGPHQALTQEELAIRVAAQLRHAFPQLPDKPLWHKVIAEKRATFSCFAGMQRPPAQTSWPGLYLAGDYVAGDYPATIEGACRSGVQCAELILDTLPS